MGSRINRNIVECKYLWQERKYSGRRELIETLWNVNKGGIAKTTSADN